VAVAIAMDAQTVTAWMNEIAASVRAERDYLVQLDAAIGDGDHGINLNRGFDAVTLALSTEPDGTPGKLLILSGKTLISTVGGASGALYGTFFLQASTIAGNRTELSPSEFGSVLEKGLAGIVLRGKATIGDKTMVDALQPAIKAYKHSIESGETLDQALSKAASAAEEGLKSTIPLVARKGRASYLGERSAGHPDPGATSTLILFRSAAETLG